MKTTKMGKPMTLTKEMYKRIGQATAANKNGSQLPRRGKLLPYTTDRLDPRNHIRFQ